MFCWREKERKIEGRKGKRKGYKKERRKKEERKKKRKEKGKKKQNFHLFPLFTRDPYPSLLHFRFSLLPFFKIRNPRFGECEREDYSTSFFLFDSKTKKNGVRDFKTVKHKPLCFI